MKTVTAAILFHEGKILIASAAGSGPSGRQMGISRRNRGTG